jgi:hypothetical protein
MTFSVVYQVPSKLSLGKSFTSTHVISSNGSGFKVKYSATESLNVVFNTFSGNFTIASLNVGKVKFVITVILDNQYGYNIPIEIDIVNQDKDKELIQYIYPTSSPCLVPIEPIFPIHNQSDTETESYTYCLSGAPTGIVIDRFTGVISGKSNIPGRFSMIITVLEKETNNFICKNDIIMTFYTIDEITNINVFLPGNEMIHAKNVVFRFICEYNGCPPTLIQSKNYILSSPVFKTTFLADYFIGDFLHFTYIVDMSNLPGAFPIRLEDSATGYFIQTNQLFTLMAACFNEDTTILTIVNDEEIYKPIKDIKVDDEIITYRHGIKKVTHIGSNTLVNNPDSISDCMYRLPMTNPEYAELTHDLILLGRHSILVDELTKVQKRKTNEIHPVDRIDDKVLLITMFNDDFEIINDQNTYTYYHLVLEKEKDKIDRRYGVYVNGGAVIAATTYKTDFVKQFPDSV